MSAHTPIAPPSDAEITDDLLLDEPSMPAMSDQHDVAEPTISADNYLSNYLDEHRNEADDAEIPSATDPLTADHVPPVLAKILGGLGRLLITIGVLLLLFAGFQLWGTGLAESRAQEDLADRFNERLAEQAQSATAAVDATDRATVRLTAGPDFETLDPTVAEEPLTVEVPQPDDAPVPPPVETVIHAPPPEVGTPIGMLAIPAIGVDKTIVEGTTRDALRAGPGHYASTPLPGRVGNTAIAGHRTTHGAPFFDLDLLQPGDEIHVETLEGTATYLVEAHDDGIGGQTGHLIVDPTEVGVIADKGDNRLTLTACHPKYSAKERIIVTATLVTAPLSPLVAIPPLEQEAEPAPAPELVTETPAPSIPTPGPTNAVATNDQAGIWPDEPGINSDINGNVTDGLGHGEYGDDAVAISLGWQRNFLPATMLWAAITGLIAAAGWVVGKLWRRWPAYAMTVPPFSLALFYCFSNLEKFLPAV